MPEEYATLQKWLHWLVALGALAAISLGVWMANIESGPTRDRLYFLHKSLGATVLGLMGLRVAARLGLGAPALPSAVPRAQRRAAKAAHLTLYGLLIATPLLGWAAASAYPAPLPFWGLGELPPLLGPDRALSEQLFNLHELAGLAIAMVVGIHVIAAFWHLLALKDGVFQRMWFRFSDR